MKRKSTPPPRQLWAPAALLPGGWAKDVHLEWSSDGTFTSITVGRTAADGVLRAAGPVVPGMPNLHSHAFQRGCAGLTEYRAEAQDSFWSWRTLMYGMAARLSPEQVEAIATWLYVEMLEAGYTSVCEFHYLHHDVDGRPYADPATLAHCLLRAAAAAGIGMTLLPVLYQTSGFGDKPPSAQQKRFLHRTEEMLRLLETLQPACAAQGARLGLAPHSLRAVPPAALRDALQGLDALDATAPRHIHVAEQTREVDDCLAWSGQRPVEWLLDHVGLDDRWCLVHATHLSEDERLRAARTGAVAGLCPTTEANLGDGLFDMPGWLDAGGAWGVGSDSQVCVNAAEELLLLEYGQRLQLRQRNVLAQPGQRQTATAMTLQAVQGGARAAGRPVAGLAIGQQADFVVLDASHVALRGLSGESMLASHVFGSSRRSALRDVWVAGVQRVFAGRHFLHFGARQVFGKTRGELAATES